jgi:hypothetical protein
MHGRKTPAKHRNGTTISQNARLTDSTRGSMLGYLAGGGEPAAARGGETRRIIGAVGASATSGVEG